MKRVMIHISRSPGLCASLQDLLAWTKDKSEVEIADLVLKLRDKLVRPVPSSTTRHL